MFIGAGLLGAIAFLVIWLGLGHLILGIIVGLGIAAIGGGGIYLGGPRNRNQG